MNDLFDYTAPPKRPEPWPRGPHQITRADDPETSHEAGEALMPSLNALQTVVLDEITAAGATGLTDLEINERCFAYHGERKESTYRKRRGELVERKLVVDSGRRELQDGRNRIVWVLSKYKETT